MRAAAHDMTVRFIELLSSCHINEVIVFPEDNTLLNCSTYKEYGQPQWILFINMCMLFCAQITINCTHIQK